MKTKLYLKWNFGNMSILYPIILVKGDIAYVITESGIRKVPVLPPITEVIHKNQP